VTILLSSLTKGAKNEIKNFLPLMEYNIPCVLLYHVQYLSLRKESIMADFKMYNQEIQDRSGRRIGKIYNKEIQDSSGRRVGKVYNQEIQDRSGRRIGKVYNQVIQDSAGRKIATIGEIRKEIDGTNTMDPVYLAALWLCFVKRGI
jgi:sporulation protein YlmC with PRC-barrel domain